DARHLVALEIDPLRVEFGDLACDVADLPTRRSSLVRPGIGRLIDEESAPTTAGIEQPAGIAARGRLKPKGVAVELLALLQVADSDGCKDPSASQHLDDLLA